MYVNLSKLEDAQDMSSDVIDFLSEAEVDADNPKVIKAIQAYLSQTRGNVEPVLYEDSSPYVYSGMDPDEVRIAVEKLTKIQDEMETLMERIQKGKKIVSEAFEAFNDGKKEYYSIKDRFTAYRETDEWYFTNQLKKQAVWNQYKKQQSLLYELNGERLARAKHLKQHLSSLWDRWFILQAATKEVGNRYVWAEYFANQEGKSILPRENEGLNFIDGDTTEVDALESLNMNQLETLDWLNPDVDDPRDLLDYDA